MIIKESVKPMEQIDGIKIFQVDGLNGSGHAGNGEAAANSNGNLADQVVNRALRYRSEAPLVDSLLADLGLNAGDLNGLTSALKTDVAETSSTKSVSTEAKTSK